MANLIRSEEACALLGVTRPTLYSYVSRGLLRALPGPDHRSRLYRRAEIERLARRPQRRKPGHAASGALDFGPPLLQSALTLIEQGRLHYRGRPALQLAQRASLEDAARLLWAVPDDPFTANAPALQSTWQAVVAQFDTAAPLQRALAGFGLAGAARHDDDPAALLRLLAAVLLGRKPSAAPLHRQCAQAWKLSAAGADLVRGALVLCADHELNVSSFAVRVVASTGASLREALRGGLAAMSGPRHGGASELAETLWDEVAGGAEPQAALLRRIERGEWCGFGHPLYPAGDPRATWILERLPQKARHPALQAAAQQTLGEAPNIDFALVALRRHLGLPRGGAQLLFCLGRGAGWVAHALEQRPLGLIRPRAVYNGLRPD